MRRATFLLLAMLALVVTHPTGATAQSWLSPWAERIPITVNNSGTPLTNYQVEIKLDNSFRFMVAKPDGSDLQVTGADGLTLLPFWVEDWDSVAMKATIYVKAPTIAPGTTVIYLYYGNPAASNTSNAASVFDFYDGFEASFASPGPAMTNAPAYQITPTYDGSGQVVEPAIVNFPGGWNGWNYWLIVQPYPNNDATFENPSLLVSNDGATWQVPSGQTNPIAIHPGQPNLSDGELFYDSVSNSLFVYYNQDYVAPGTLGFLKKSDSAGVNWGPELTVLAVPVDDILSQAVLQVSSSPVTYGMWYVNANGGGCNGVRNPVEYRTSPDGVNWSAPTTQPTFDLPGWSNWHPDMIYVPSKGEYWSVMAAYPTGQSCQSTSLFFAKSRDGINWTVYSQPIVAPSTSGWDNKEIYKSTLLYDAATDMLRVWYSAQDTSGNWHMGYTQRTYSSLLASLTSTWTTIGTGSWTQSTNQVKRGSYSGQLLQNSGSDFLVVHAQPDGTNFYQEWDMYDDMSSPSYQVVRVYNGNPGVGIGINTGCSTSNYCFHDISNRYTAGSSRSPGWHKFGVRIGSDSTATFFVDGVQVGLLTGQFNAAGQISIEGSAGLPKTYYLDDVRIRKSAAVEPSVTVGGTQNQAGIDAPVAQSDSYSIRSGSANISAPGVLGNDTDPQHYPITTTVFSPPANGTLHLNSDGSFIYTPNPGFTGTDSFTYVANNGVFNSNEATVTISVSQWMNLSWPVSSTVSISNPCGNTCTNYQVHISLDASFDFSKALSDGSDLRVTAGDGVTSIPFWIESWDPVAKQASLWVKVPTIPPGGTTINLYYGNPSPPAPPGPTTVNLPPVGPWTIPANNLISPIGSPHGSSNLLAENIVYDDPATGGDGKYWLAFADFTNNTIALAWSLTPANPTSWQWDSLNPVVSAANAPFLIKDGSIWYLFFADRTHGTLGQLDMRIATASSPGGPYTRVPGDTAITGTSVTLTAGSTAMVGVGTSFTTQLAVGQLVKMTSDVTDAWIRICSIASATSATLCSGYTGSGGKGAAVFNAGGIVLWPSSNWEDYRVDEPFVMKMPDGTYMLTYMGDSGGNVEQIGYATAPVITGPYTQYVGNPAMPFGPTNSYDSGTVADPWIYPVGGTYYIGYSASPTTSSPWHAGLSTTTDFKTFTRAGVTLASPTGGNSFRGGVTRAGNTLVYTYAADNYDSRIATQPATVTVNSSINNPHAVFDFYDDFSGSSLDPTNWVVNTAGTGGTATISSGLLSLKAQSTPGNLGTVELLGPATIGKSSIFEVYGRHLDGGLNATTQANAGFELGLATQDMNNAIRLMDFPDLTNYTAQGIKLGTGPLVTASVGYDKTGNWHTYQIYRDASNNAIFNVDGSLVSTVGANVPDWNLPPMLMSYANDPAPQSRFQVGWVRARQACGTGPSVTVGAEELPNGDHAPVANSQSVSTPHDVSVAITLTASDIDGDPITYSVTSGPAHGSLTGTAPNLVYTPVPNYHGSDAFTFHAFDGQGYSNLATVSITVTYVDHAPTASSRSVTTNEESPTPVLLSATDPDGDPLTYIVVSGPTYGTVSGSGPSLTYTPSPLYYGPDSFQFKANDGILDSNVATVSITVVHLNHPPVANADSYLAVGGQALSVGAPGVLGNDTDLDGDILTAILVSGPSHGSLVLYPNGAIRYVPNSGYTGNDSFTYMANDGLANSTVATVSIAVSGWFNANWTDRRTVAMSNPCSAVCSNYQVQIKLNASNFDFTKAKIDGSDIQVTDSDAVTALPFYVETWNPAGATASIWVKVPSIPITGTTLYLYYANASPPVLANDPSLVFDFWDGFDGTAIDTTKWTTNLAAGSIAVSGSIAVLTSTSNYTQLYGKSSFTTGNIFEVYGRHENQGTATALFAVGWRTGTDFNNTTRLMDWSGATNDETKYHAASSGGNTTNLFSNYKDSTTLADRNWHTFGVYRSTSGTADFRVDGSSVITPLIGSPYVLSSAMPLWIGTFASGTTSKFDVDWARLRKFCGTDPVATVGPEQPFDHAPTAVNDAYSVQQNTTLTVPKPGVLSNDTDPDGDPLTAILVSNPSHGTVTLSPTGAFTYVPATGYSGLDSFTYQANDGVLNSNVATVSLTITASTLSQTITFGGLSNQTYGVAAYTLSATASSGLAVSFSVVSGPASISGNTITILGAGVVTVEADQAGNATYAAAPPVQQSFTVAGAVLTVTANNASMNYGGTLPGLTATISGFVNGDSPATATSGSPALSTSASSTSPVGTYGITASVGTLTAANYTFSFVNGTLTITKATASVTPNAAGKTYGAADPTLTGTLTGFLASDNVTASYSRVAGETVGGGPYTISATLSPAAVLSNYNITYNTAAFTITKALLTVSANNLSKFSGSANPILTYSVAGFVRGDTQAVLSGAPSLTTTATLTSPPGTYPITITVGSLAAANYTFTFVNGTLTVNAAVTLSPTIWSFGSQLKGTTSTGQTFRLTNAGSTSVSISAIALSGANAGDFSQTTTCGASLASSANCTITVKYTPTVTGPESAILVVTDSDPSSPQTAALSGTGVAPILSVSLLSLSFSSPINFTTAAQPVTVSNTGTASLTISSITLTGTNSNQFGQTNTCGSALAAGNSCTVNVVFSPTSANNKNATLNINVAAPASSQSVTLTGTIVAPTYTLVPTSLAFGTVKKGTVSSPQTITLTNTSTLANLTISSITKGGNNQGQFVIQSTTCSGTIAAHATCQINLTFNPESTGAKSATINVNVAAPGTNSSVPVSGTGN